MKRLATVLIIIIPLNTFIGSCSGNSSDKKVLEEKLKGIWSLPGGEGSGGCGSFYGSHFHTYYMSGSHGLDSYSISTVNCTIEYLSKDEIRLYDCTFLTYTDGPRKVIFTENDLYAYVSIEGVRTFHRRKARDPNSYVCP